MQFVTYLTFAGKCEEAMKSYQSVLGGDIPAMVRYGESPDQSQVDPKTKDLIMHARLIVGDAVLMASDAPPQYQQKPQGFSVAIQVDDPKEADRIFAALGAGGTVNMPMQETFWAKKFGMLIDRYGIPWMVNCEKPRPAM